MKNGKEIPIELVKKYIHWRDAEKTAKTNREILRQKLIVCFEKGMESPASYPFLVVMEEVEKTKIDWKKYAFALAKKLYGNLWGREVKKFMAAAVPQTEQRITVSVNAAYSEQEQ